MSDELTRPEPTAVDLFAPSAPPSSGAKAGKGSEDLGSHDVILPRASIQQAMSKQVLAKVPGSDVGVWFLKPFNRPLNHPEGKDGLPKAMRIVVARIFPAMRRWQSLDEGGGILCEASTGKYQAREPNGLMDARLELELNKKKDAVAKVSWEGGSPTADCHACVYGLCAEAAASRPGGRLQPGSHGNVWLPKMVVQDDRTWKLDDKLRSPICTPSLDALVYVLVPAFGDAPAEVLPCYLSFAKTSTAAGKQLASMIKLNPREAAWSKIYEVGTRSVTNDRGTFSVATVGVLGYAPERMMAMAEQLYDDSLVKTYGTEFDNEDSETAVPSESSRTPEPDRDSAPAPQADDKF